MLVRAFIAFLALPGLFAILVPRILAAIDPWRGHGLPIGWAFVGAGLIIIVWCAWDFYAKGRGTLAPWDPPKHLVVNGLYRLVRNPMYVGVLVLVGGIALVGGSVVVAAYLAFLAAVFHVRVVLNEEAWLAKHFLSEWEAYAAAVPRWLPRLKPWRSHTVGR